MSDGSFRMPVIGDPAGSGEVTPPYRTGAAPLAATGRPKRTRIHHLRDCRRRPTRSDRRCTRVRATAQTREKARTTPASAATCLADGRREYAQARVR